MSKQGLTLGGKIQGTSNFHTILPTET